MEIFKEVVILLGISDESISWVSDNDSDNCHEIGVTNVDEQRVGFLYGSNPRRYLRETGLERTQSTLFHLSTKLDWTVYRYKDSAWVVCASGRKPETSYDEILAAIRQC